MKKKATLTPAEIEVITWLRHGKTTNEISKILGKSPHTVNFHVQNIKKKLNVVRREQAVAEAIYSGIIDT